MKTYNSVPKSDHTYLTSDATTHPIHTTTDSCNVSNFVNAQVNSDGFAVNSIPLIE